MFRILYIYPDRAAITVIEKLPRFAAVVRAIEPAAGGRVDKILGRGVNLQ
jgi:hypothetical protein